MKSIFVDSGGFFALLIQEDALHTQAVALFQQANRERWQLVNNRGGV